MKIILKKTGSFPVDSSRSTIEYSLQSRWWWRRHQRRRQTGWSSWRLVRGLPRCLFSHALFVNWSPHSSAWGHHWQTFYRVFLAFLINVAILMFDFLMILLSLIYQYFSIVFCCLCSIYEIFRHEWQSFLAWVFCL